MTVSTFMAGLYNGVIGKRDQNGYAKGTLASPNAGTSGDSVVTHALFIEHPVQVDAPTGERIRVDEFSGQKPRGVMDLGAGPMQAFNTIFARNDESLNAIADGSATNTTQISGVTQGGENIIPETLNDMFQFWTMGGQLVSDTGVRSSIYGHWWYPYVTMSLVPTGIAQQTSSAQNPNNATYSSNPNLSTKLPTGGLLSELSVGYTENVRHKMRSTEKLWMVTTAIMDGTDTTIQLLWLPKYSDASTGGRNLIMKNGTATAVTSVNTTTGLVTLAAAGTLDDIWVIFYPITGIRV